MVTTLTHSPDARIASYRWWPARRACGAAERADDASTPAESAA